MFLQILKDMPNDNIFYVVDSLALRLMCRGAVHYVNLTFQIFAVKLSEYITGFNKLPLNSLRNDFIMKLPLFNVSGTC